MIMLIAKITASIALKHERDSDYDFVLCVLDDKHRYNNAQKNASLREKCHVASYTLSGLITL